MVRDFLHQQYYKVGPKNQLQIGVGNPYKLGFFESRQTHLFSVMYKD